MIGLIVPPAHGRVPDDARVLFPDVEFRATGLAIAEMTETGFAVALPRLESAVADVVGQGASAISLMGTSLTFFRGRAGNDALLARLSTAAEGIPCSTMATALVRAIHQVGARRVSVLSAYIPDMSRRLTAFLRQHDIEVVGETHLGIHQIDQLAGVTADLLIEHGTRLLARTRGSEALVISCGGLDTLEAILEIEGARDLPVVSSSQAGLWDIVDRAGLAVSSPHSSRLMHSRERRPDRHASREVSNDQSVR